jgi:hypothetical protein
MVCILQPSHMNFCVMCSESVVVTRYISSKEDDSTVLLVSNPVPKIRQLPLLISPSCPPFPCDQCFSSGTKCSEYAQGGHYKRSKSDKRESRHHGECLFPRSVSLGYRTWTRTHFPSYFACQIASEPLIFQRGTVRALSAPITCLVNCAFAVLSLTTNFCSILLCGGLYHMEFKTSHVVDITPKMNLLQIRIKDGYFVSPSHPAARARATKFAQKQGLLNQRQELLAKAGAASTLSKGSRH